MSITRISTALGNECATSALDTIDAGSGPGLIRFYTTPMPATVDTAITSQTLLGTLTCSDPCGSVANKTLTFSAITQDSSADANGQAEWARIEDSNGVAVLDVDVTATGGGGAITLNTVTIVEGGPIVLTGFSVAFG